MRLEFWSRRACVRHTWWRTKRSWPLFSPTFFFFFLFSFFFSAFYFAPTSGNLPCVKICFPQYFGITRRYMQNDFFLGSFYFFYEKTDFRAITVTHIYLKTYYFFLSMKEFLKGEYYTYDALWYCSSQSKIIIESYFAACKFVSLEGSIRSFWDNWHKKGNFRF